MTPQERVVTSPERVIMPCFIPTVMFSTILRYRHDGYCCMTSCSMIESVSTGRLVRRMLIDAVHAFSLLHNIAGHIVSLHNSLH